MAPTIMCAARKSAAISPGRRHLLLAAAGLCLACGRSSAQGGGRVTLTPSVSLAEEATAASRAGQPLVVLVSLDGCPICRAARDSYLGPLRDEQGVPVVQVDMGSARPTRDFAGRSVTHDQLVNAWSVGIAPTVLFFGPGGREIAPRLAGGYLPDFYGAYLEDRVREARRVLGR